MPIQGFELSVDGINLKIFLIKLFGTGWYSSRVTINSSRNRMIDVWRTVKK